MRNSIVGVIVIGLKKRFGRCYRNPLIHRGSTWKSTVNRAQVRDGARILEKFVPAIVHIVLEHPNEEWGTPCFPPVES